MSSLTCTITDAGLAALIAASGTNAVTIAEAGLTASTFAPLPTLTDLPGEFKRISTVSGVPIDGTTVHLTIRDSSTDAYSVKGIGLYLDDGTLFAVYAQDEAILGKAEVSTFFLAIDLKLLAGQADLVQFGNTNFIDPPASETVKGVAYLATIAEALAGAVADRVITPATMRAVLDNYVMADALGVPNGIATLGPDGKLITAQRPPIDLVDVFAVSSEAAMTALDATVGDFAVRSDNGLVYVLQQWPASYLPNWLEISTPAPVSSVNGKVGAVVLNSADLGAVPTGRSIGVSGGLLTGGGSLDANRTIGLEAASQDECWARAIGNKVVTPLGLEPLVFNIVSKVPNTRRVDTTGPLLTGGGSLNGDLTLGIVAATAADVLSATATDRAVTPAALGGLAKSMTPNGYIYLPGGLLLQWIRYRSYISSEGSRFVAFPIVFPNQVLLVDITGYNATGSNHRDLWPQLLGEASTTGCSVFLQTDDGNDDALDGFNLFAIGY